MLNDGVNFRHDVDVCVGACVGVCVDVCADLCLDMCVDLCLDMCVDVCLDLPQRPRVNRRFGDETVGGRILDFPKSKSGLDAAG